CHVPALPCFYVHHHESIARRCIQKLSSPYQPAGSRSPYSHKPGRCTRADRHPKLTSCRCPSGSVPETRSDCKTGAGESSHFFAPPELSFKKCVGVEILFRPGVASDSTVSRGVCTELSTTYAQGKNFFSDSSKKRENFP